MRVVLTLSLAIAAAPCLAETAAGIAYLSDTAVAARPLSLSIWYPSSEDASATVGGNAVFKGAPAAPGASLPGAELPLVALSHGGLRSAADSGAWLAASMAQAGFIVVEVNAPRPVDAATALDEIWRRPQDIRRTLDLLLDDETWAARIDEDRIAVAGFALGATAALSVAGADLHTERYTRACDNTDGGAEAPDCGWFAAQGVALSDTSKDGLASLTADPRVTSVIALKPEYSAAVGPVPADVSELAIYLGGVPDASDALPRTRSVTISGSSGFDAFSVCTDAGPDLLREEGGDLRLCGASDGSRSIVHRSITETIVSFLRDDID
ncbi:Alpha/beta hydrolase family protein [Roseivivax jejudonensis]|uniref:Alpha/beta hydrolase family protein n=1 Tax=Roseivivax jejudonensis TaxID=1529041 RepID=A0A1X6Y6A4_9RHOB|nr:hypothetical protein [Roseivivax jejudonensis]SLN11802.1 Alpha/beta hydrolase family protein [Roseivivax jejudonensis]